MLTLLFLICYLVNLGDKWATDYNTKMSIGKTPFFQKSDKTKLAEAIRDGIMKSRLDLGEDTGHWGNSDWEL